MNTACPFCDYTASDMQLLVVHVLAHHGDEQVNGVSLEIPTHEKNHWVGCWCERLFFNTDNPRNLKEHSTLAGHWRRCGGPAAHILALVLLHKGVKS